MKRGQINPRSWDAAIRAVQTDMLELAAQVPLSDEQDQILTTAFRRCGELLAKKYLVWTQSNRELARKYSISSRTVTNWRREGCPFERGQWRVLDWIARRRYAPAGTRAKFGKQLARESRGPIVGGLRYCRELILGVRAAHRQAGLPVPDWVRSTTFRER